LLVAPIAAGFLAFSCIGCGNSSNGCKTRGSGREGYLKVPTNSSVELLPSRSIGIAGLPRVALARVRLPLSSNDWARPNEGGDGESGEEKGYKQGKLPHASARVKTISIEKCVLAFESK